MKPIAIISIIIVILIIAILIGLSIYYNVKQTPKPTSIPELLGFKTADSTTPTKNSKLLDMNVAGYFVIGVVGAVVIALIITALFIFLPNWGATY